MKQKVFLSSLFVSAALIGLAGSNNTNVQAATKRNYNFGAVTYTGKGGVLLRDKNGNIPATRQYVKNGTTWKYFTTKFMHGEQYYRLGNDNQFIQSKYFRVGVSVGPSVTPVTKSVSVVYYGAGKVALRNSNGHIAGQYVGNGTSWKVNGTATINGQLHYRLGNNNQWLPSQYAVVDGASQSIAKMSNKFLQQVDNKIIYLLNDYRKKNGLKPLIVNNAIQNIAYKRAVEETASERNGIKSDHKRPNGSSFSTAFVGTNLGYGAMGENLFAYHSYEYFTVDALANEAVIGWINSPGHRDNILTRRFTHIGAKTIRVNDHMVMLMNDFWGR